MLQSMGSQRVGDNSDWNEVSSLWGKGAPVQEDRWIYFTENNTDFSDFPQSLAWKVILHSTSDISKVHSNDWASRVALMVKNPPASASDIRDVGWIPGSGRSPGWGWRHGNPLQNTCLENPWIEEPCRVHGVTKSQTPLKQLSTHLHSRDYLNQICFQKE